MAQESLTKQFISREGEFDAAAMQEFSTSVGLHGCGLSYAVVAVIGPQSSGKSTLMNHLFGTNFREMNALEGRGQTTTGMWIGKAEGRQPLTLVMDSEGTDSQERGEDGTAFEKQSSLFALAVADVVVMNICCNDIGRENASSRPLYRSVFQAMMRLVNNPTKKTLIYVIRDKTKTPLEKLEPKLREDIQEIWDEITPKPRAYKDTRLTEIFNVEVTALSNYEDKEQEFKKEVVQLRQHYFPSILAGGPACAGPSVLPGSEFCSTAEEIWKMIKENKDLDLPAHRIMVATVRCDEIANEKLTDFKSDQDWIDLKEAANANAGAVLRFGESASTILNKYLSKYDEESQYFDEKVRNAKHEDLELKAFQLIHPTYKTILRQLHSISLQHFKVDLTEHLGRGQGFVAAVRTCHRSSTLRFDRKCLDAAIKEAKWDASEVRETLHRDIEAHALLVRNEMLQHKLIDAQKECSEILVEEVKSGFENCGQDPWPPIRRLMDSRCAESGSVFKSLFEGFELDRPTAEKMAKDLKEDATRLVKRLAEARVDAAVPHMLKRFYQVNPEAKDDLKNEALDECLKLLSFMAAMRLDEGFDNVQDVLHSALRNGNSDAGDLTSNTWVNVHPENTLITPFQCRTLWNEFVTIMEHRNAKAKGGGWGKMIILGLTIGAAAVTIVVYPEMTAAAATAIFLSISYQVVCVLGSLSFGLFKKKTLKTKGQKKSFVVLLKKLRDFYRFFKREMTNIVPIIMEIAELFYIIVEAARRRQQVGRLMIC